MVDEAKTADDVALIAPHQPSLDEVHQQLVAAAEKALPRIDEALQRARYSDAERRSKLVQLHSFGLEEDLLLRLLGITPAGAALERRPPRSIVRRRFEIAKHSLRRWLKARGVVERLFYLIGWGTALLGPSIVHGLTWWGSVAIAVVLAIRFRVAQKEFSPKHMPILQLNHDERQLQLEKLIHTMQRWVGHPPSRGEVLDFQRDTLKLIASYVRDHRSDLKGKKIFANLLVRRGHAIAVLARSDVLNRKLPEFYKPEECSVAWETMQTGAPQFTGDVYEDAPDTRKGKTYRSIMTMPVKRDGAIIGVVSIDSEAMFHFDQHFTDLQTELAPYVQLLAVTLREDHDTSTSEQRGLPSPEAPDGGDDDEHG